MKKVLLSAVLVLVASNAFALISGSPHDFKSTGASTHKGTSDQTCKYCHVPHNGLATGLLWARGAAIGVATKYASTTLNAVTAVPSAPQSLLCLGCHNSTASVALTAGVDIVGVVPVNRQINDLANGLTNDHPIAFPWNAALVGADPNLNPVVTVATKDAIGAVGTTRLPLFGATGAATMECATCHAVHGAVRPVLGTYIQQFLRTTNAGSVLCLKCHIK